MNDGRFSLILRTDSLEIPVEVTRKRVKNLNLRVRGDGSVTLSIPMRTSPSTAEEFLARKTDWIVSRVRRARAREGWGSHGGPGLPTHFPLWGDLAPCGPDLIDSDSVDELYRYEVLRALPDVIERMECRVGVHATRWSVRAMKTRWGSCTPKTGAIRINARLAAYPPECLEFVVAHELVHLLEPSHNARFHALLDEFCPENRTLAQRLKQAATSIPAESLT